MNHSSILIKLFYSAVQKTLPEHCLQKHVEQLRADSVVLLALGKSATNMAAVCESVLAGHIRTGCAVTAYKHAVKCSLAVKEAAHPVPDAASVRAAEALLKLAHGATEKDTVLMLLSGGGSSLACAPANPLTLEQKQSITKRLLRSGARINEMNCVRKHLSAIKGGRLAQAAYPARTVTLAISDVPADSPQSIASGPTVPDDSTCADCLDVVRKYNIALPKNVVALLKNNALETPKADNLVFANTQFTLVASPQQLLEHAVKQADNVYPHVVNMKANWYDDAATIAREHVKKITTAKEGTLFLSGGEASVRVSGSGKGGRNGQFLLSLACMLENSSRKVWAIACDTDGIDGNGDNAGAVLTPDSLTRAKNLGIDAHKMLADNNSYAFFSALDDLVVTRPTGTNVNDFRAIVVY